MWQSVSGERRWSHYALGRNAANCRYVPSKKPAYAETFFVVPVREYMELCARYFGNRPRILYYGSHYVESAGG